ncbi:MAG TPA: DUF3135 domain-containing protein [Gammaproteobacteria bacterium]|nr:DUF3135 domain-containing protein [Gammaproteobacteria bacterium]
MRNKINKLADRKPIQGGFDFDYWRNLAKKDPAAFEAAREQEINQHIAGIADGNTQERLRRLQWRVEMERKLSKNPMDAAVRLYDMMWESVGKNFDALQDLTSVLKPTDARKNRKPANQAKVLRFKQEEVADTVS